LETNNKIIDKRYKRLFIGISLSKGICDYFYNLTLNLSKENNNIKPIPPQNIHITLKFLGNVKTQELENIYSNIELSLKDIKNFKFNINDNLDGFPKITSSRILFASIGDGSAQMEEIFEKIKKNLSKIGFNRDEKKFIPHITIARMKLPINFTGLIENLNLKKFENIKCDKIILFESILSSKGPQYLIEKVFVLK